jgi:hypothetical protein
MTTTINQPIPTLQDLPDSLQRKGAIDIELEQGVLILRASKSVQNRIETLLIKQRTAKLTSAEE